MIDTIFTTLIEEGFIAFLFASTLWWIAVRYERLIKSLAEMIGINNILILGLQKELLCHDLTVTGLNPSTGVELDERANKALSKYEELQRTFNVIEEHLKRIANK